MTDQYEWWRNALAGNVGPIHDGEPQSGFYRSKSKNKQTGAVSHNAIAYWRNDAGDLKCQINGKPVDEQRALEQWTFCCRNPITFDLHRDVVMSGNQWPDTNEVVERLSNNPPADDSIESISERIQELSREANKLIEAGAAGDQNAADRASDLANSFGEMETKVGKLHQVEKAPVLQAGREIDAKWFALRDIAKELKAKIKAVVVTPYLRKKDDEARAARAAAEKAARDAAMAGKPTPQPTVAPPARTMAGSSKRSVSLRTYYSAQIEDRAALLTSQKDHPEVVAVLQKIADAAASKQIALPGCKVVEERRAA